MNPIRKILVPVDFSDHSENALREGEARARIHGAELLVLHVLQQTPFPTRQVLRHKHFPNLQDEIRNNCLIRLEEMKAKIVGKDLAPRLELRDGLPSTEIVDFAAEEDIDLIVIATQGHTGLKRLLLGSTTERVVRLAPCSVLVTRRKGAHTQ